MATTFTPNGNTLNISNILDSDWFQIPSPPAAGWTLTCMSTSTYTGTMFTAASANPNPPPPQLPASGGWTGGGLIGGSTQNLRISGAGTSGALSAVFRGNTATLSWDMAKKEATFTSAAGDTITITITCGSGG
jgi:hypothetical protein